MVRARFLYNDGQSRLALIHPRPLLGILLPGHWPPWSNHGARIILEQAAGEIVIQPDLVSRGRDATVDEHYDRPAPHYRAARPKMVAGQQFYTLDEAVQQSYAGGPAIGNSRLGAELDVIVAGVGGALGDQIVLDGMEDCELCLEVAPKPLPLSDSPVRQCVKHLKAPVANRVPSMPWQMCPPRKSVVAWSHASHGRLLVLPESVAAHAHCAASQFAGWLCPAFHNENDREPRTLPKRGQATTILATRPFQKRVAETRPERLEWDLTAIRCNSLRDLNH